jgi:Flp pilus assembly protein TadG
MQRMMHSEEGSVAIIVGLLLFLLIMAVGVAVDMTRAQILEQRMSASLDAAGLAAAETIGSPPASLCPAPETQACATIWANQVAARYFTANFPSGYLGSTIPAPVVTVTPDFDTLNLSITGTQQPIFMQTFGFNSMSVTATSQVTRSSNGSGMELVLVLDNTGSMNQQVDPSDPSSVPKIQALQSSINGSGGLLDILFGGNTSVPNLYVGVVPFSQAVNIGTGGNQVVVSGDMDASYNSTLAWDPSDVRGQWKGCIEERSGAYTVTDDVPSVSVAGTLLRKYYTRPANQSTDSPFWPVYYNTWAEANPSPPPAITYDYSLDPVWDEDKGPNQYCPQVITPMQTDRSIIQTAIASMVPDGDTLIPEGLVWGWRMLSPNWQGHWQDTVMTTNSLPLAYNTTNMQKVVILMTDGSNHLVPGNYTAYGFVGDSRLGVDEPTSETILDNNLTSICNSLRSHNVTVFTIAFGQAGSNPITQTERNNGMVDVQLLTSCATSPGYFFLAPTNAALQSAFQSIGNTLENIRISK